MNVKKQNSFFKSDNVLRYKLGGNAAIILSVLVYKFEYWKKVEKLELRNGRNYFYISLNDLIAETTLTKGVVAKNIKLLKSKGLVYVKQQGLNKPNLYSIDQELIDSYIEKYRHEFQEWQIRTRRNSQSLRNNGKCENHTSRSNVKGTQDYSIKSATNNKNINNKNTKNVTNRAGSAKVIDLEYQLGCQLEEEISNLRSLDDKEKQVTSLFFFLCNLVPSFKDFNMSDSDRYLILKLNDNEIQEYKLASKILSNASDIIEGRKESRFGSLFVGISEMISNYDKIIA